MRIEQSLVKEVKRFKSRNERKPTNNHNYQRTKNVISTRTFRFEYFLCNLQMFNRIFQHWVFYQIIQFFFCFGYFFYHWYTFYIFQKIAFNFKIIVNHYKRYAFKMNTQLCLSYFFSIKCTTFNIYSEMQ